MNVAKVWLVCLCSGLQILWACLAAAETPKDRFLRAAPEGWSRLRSAERHLAGRLHVETRRANLKDDQSYVLTDRIIDFKISGNNTLIDLSTSGKDSHLINVVGPEYQFQVERSSDPKAQRLVGFMKGIPANEEEDIVHKNREFSYALKAHYSIWGIPLDEVISDPGFVLKDVAETGGSGGLIRVSFSIKSKKTKMEITDCYMILNPSMDWALQESKYYWRPDFYTLVTNELTTIKGKILIKRSNLINGFTKDKLEERNLYDFTGLAVEDVPKTQFMLQSFGLPEPAEPARASRRSSLHHWFIGLGAVLACAALVIRRRASRVASGAGH